MSDEIDELTRAQVVIGDLSSPTDREFVYATDGFSERTIAGAAAKMALEGGGGGGSLPDWWTVDSTPGAESVTFVDQNADAIARIYDDGSGEVHVVEVQGSSERGAAFRVLDENGVVGEWTEQRLMLQLGQFVLKDGATNVLSFSATAGEPANANLGRLNVGQTTTDLPAATAMNIYAFTDPLDTHLNSALEIWDPTFSVRDWWVASGGYEGVTHHAAPDDAWIHPGECFSWFDATNGAASFNRKGKTLDGTVVSASTPMTP